jgi:hypothetical protein
LTDSRVPRNTKQLVAGVAALSHKERGWYLGGIDLQ